MDEIVFRGSQKVENLQIHLSLAASNTKRALEHYTEVGKSFASQAWNSSQVTHFRENVKDFIQIILERCRQYEQTMSECMQVANPKKIYTELLNLFGKNWTKRDTYFLCIGFICGGLVGITIGMMIHKKTPILRYMQAVRCTKYGGTEFACVIENCVAPHECGEDDVLINVKAASVQAIDAQICDGYGQTLRDMLNRIYKKSDSGLPITLGRDCTGIVTDIGTNVKRLDIGDEVWLTLPFWDQGTLSQSILVKEFRVSRKPKIIGFEGACSLPYAGSIAMSTLQQANITCDNAADKRIFVQGGCTPVGCVLIQVLYHWGAEIVTSCYKRALPVAKALGANDVIVLSEMDSPKNSSKESLNLENTNVPHSLIKELNLRDNFDIIIITSEYGLSVWDLQNYCRNKEMVFSTLPKEIPSDQYGYLSKMFLECFIKLKHVIEKIFGTTLNDYDEAHMCYVTLDQITELVENGQLQTVVDKVYNPHNIQLALAHIQSPDSIGSTVITFR